jgi:hypothetical protein
MSVGGYLFHRLDRPGPKVREYLRRLGRIPHALGEEDAVVRRPGSALAIETEPFFIEDRLEQFGLPLRKNEICTPYCDVLA